MHDAATALLTVNVPAVIRTAPLAELARTVTVYVPADREGKVFDQVPFVTESVTLWPPPLKEDRVT